MIVLSGARPVQLPGSGGTEISFPGRIFIALNNPFHKPLQPVFFLLFFSHVVTTL
jgi:hypothetical protein